MTMTQTTNTVVEFLDIQFMSEHLYKLHGKCWRKTESAALLLCFTSKVLCLVEFNLRTVRL